MKALILAAGFGTRLNPLTKDIPKAFLKIGKKTILERTLDKIFETEISKVFIVSNNKFFKIFESWFSTYPQNDKIKLLNDGSDINEDRLGSIGDIKFVIEKENIKDDLLVICSDKIFEFSLIDFCKFFKEKKTVVNIGFDTKDMSKIRGKHGCVVIDSDQKILEFQEKPENPKSTVESIAFYIYPKDMLELFDKYLKEGNNPDAPGFFLEWIIKKRDAYCFLFEEECYDVGDIESYKKVNDVYKSR
jgi:glucose-1-phosphate thymidylyltransferase